MAVLDARRIVVFEPVRLHEGERLYSTLYCSLALLLSLSLSKDSNRVIYLLEIRTVSLSAVRSVSDRSLSLSLSLYIPRFESDW